MSFFYTREYTWKTLYKDISNKLKKRFNRILVELIDLLYEISNIILQEFSEDPAKVGIDPVNYLYELHVNSKVNDQEEAYVSHVELLEDLVYYFKSSVDVYYILNRSYQRPLFKSALPTKIKANYTQEEVDNLTKVQFAKRLKLFGGGNLPVAQRLIYMIMKSISKYKEP